MTDCSGDFRPRMRIAGAGFGVRARARVGRLNCRFGAVGNTCRCFATLTFPADGFLGLASEAFAWHCFAIRSQRLAPLPLSFSRNATACNSLGCQSEVTSQSAFAESQRDGMCEPADGRMHCCRFRGAIHLLVQFLNGDHVLVYIKLGAIFCGGLLDGVRTSDAM